jgi:hypothetical protein
VGETVGLGRRNIVCGSSKITLMPPGRLHTDLLMIAARGVGLRVVAVFEVLLMEKR